MLLRGSCGRAGGRDLGLDWDGRRTGLCRPPPFSQGTSVVVLRKRELFSVEDGWTELLVLAFACVRDEKCCMISLLCQRGPAFLEMVNSKRSKASTSAKDEGPRDPTCAYYSAMSHFLSGFGIFWQLQMGRESMIDQRH